MKDMISIRGARTHNLKDVNIDIPKNQLVVITGVSGSGKSSLAFDTIYAEGQRKYVESLSAYARQFLGLMEKPDVDIIEGLSPAISIDQKSAGHNPRSTVGTVTEVYDYLRLLFARVGHPRSPKTGNLLESQTVQQIVDSILSFPQKYSNKKQKIILLGPIIKNRKGTYEELFNRLQAQGYVRVRVDGQVYNLDEEINLDRYQKHNIDVVVDRLIISDEKSNDKDFIKRLTDSVEASLNLGDGELLVNLMDQDKDIFYSEKLVDQSTGESFPEVEPHSFSFNSPYGACPNCNGLGFIKEVNPRLVYNPKLTITEGAIYPWSRMTENPNSWTMNLIKGFADEENIPIRKSMSELDEDQLNKVLYGVKSKKYKVNYKGQTFLKEFEGVVPNLMRRYEETDSDYIRKEIEEYMIDQKCSECNGYRLRKESLSVSIRGINIVDIGNISVKDSYKWMENLQKGTNTNIEVDSVLYEVFEFNKINPKNDDLSRQEREIGKQIFKEILDRLRFLVSVGLGYLTLNRTANTLSGGEAQRIRLASQIGTGLTGVLYVLDEPSIGLHQRDNDRLLDTLKNLRDIGNTLIVVEHDEDTIRKADHIIDMGPHAGENGGEIIGEGSLEDIVNNKKSITAEYLSGRKSINRKTIDNQVDELFENSELKKMEQEKINKGSIKIIGARHHNLKNVDVEFPLSKFIAVTGVSGSGKSSLINEILSNKLSKEMYRSKRDIGEHDRIEGIENVDKVINIDQSPIGRTPRSNPATYTGVFTPIRDLFASTKEAKMRGYKPGRFSFNVKGGRCENCSGDGLIKIEMQFLPDVYVTCDVCKGKRYNRDTLQIDYKGKNISDVLEMTVEKAARFFENIPTIYKKLSTLQEVGLGYIRLGQQATTLSGGEAQRIKLSSELSKRSTGKTFYILDEPTTGLHFHDINKLVVVLHSLVKKGNTVLVIEHNLDVIRTADWIIDLGPEGGENGGEIIGTGTVEEIMDNKKSYTGEWLRRMQS